MHPLEQMSFHDLPLQSLTFDFESSSCVLVIEEYDEITRDYVPLELSFKGVSKFLSDCPPDIDFDIRGCHKHTYKQLTDGLHEVCFVFELGRFSVWLITIGFTDLELKGGLSQKNDAML